MELHRQLIAFLKRYIMSPRLLFEQDCKFSNNVPSVAHTQIHHSRLARNILHRIRAKDKIAKALIRNIERLTRFLAL